MRPGHPLAFAINNVWDTFLLFGGGDLKLKNVVTTSPFRLILRAADKFGEKQIWEDGPRPHFYRKTKNFMQSVVVYYQHFDLGIF